jgi:hypothetical protein
MKELEVKLTDADDKTKIIIEEELETRRSKEKRRLLGIVKFIGQLYRHHLLIESVNIRIWFYNLLFRLLIGVLMN